MWRKHLRRLTSSNKGRELIRFCEACKYADTSVWSVEFGNDLVANALQSDCAQAIGKLGSVELQAIRSYLKRYKAVDWEVSTQAYRRVLFTNAGVFPNKADVFCQYCDFLLEDVLPKLTVFAVWFNVGEASIHRRYSCQAQLVNARALESYYSDSIPWTKVLQGKRVLVVHPFESTIKAQFLRRHEIWAGRPSILPDMELETLRVPQLPSLVPPTHPSWFAALDYLKKRMSDIEFDVALIGAGAYSLPLAVYARQMGKHGIHLGGTTQVYFGIMGRRWDEHPVISKYYNQSWQRPLPQDTPTGASIIEGGCYW